jgi:hypothetical protein
MYAEKAAVSFSRASVKSLFLSVKSSVAKRVAASTGTTGAKRASVWANGLCKIHQRQFA